MEKRIYSLNLIAFVWMETLLEPELRQDVNGVFYAVYPEVHGVAAAIHKWKNPDCEINIHNYLNVYAELRHRINDIRKGRQRDG